MKRLIMAILQSEPVKKIIKEALQILTEDVIEVLRVTSQKLLKQNLVKRLEKECKENVQLHSTGIPDSKSKIKDRGLCLVSDR